jgi:hypothetical protein
MSPDTHISYIHIFAVAHWLEFGQTTATKRWQSIAIGQSCSGSREGRDGFGGLASRGGSHQNDTFTLRTYSSFILT